MTNKFVLAAGTALAFATLFGLASCNSGSAKARAEAIQFAFSWEQTVKTVGLVYMSDPSEVEKLFRHMEPTRSALQAEGTETMRREAAQLDALVLYVAHCLDANIRANIALAEKDVARAPITVEFPDPKLNALLGLVPSDGENPQKALVALSEAINRFAAAAGVGKEYQAAKRQREEHDAADAKPGESVEPTWTQIREERMREASARKVR